MVRTQSGAKEKKSQEKCERKRNEIKKGINGTLQAKKCKQSNTKSN